MPGDCIKKILITMPKERGLGVMVGGWESGSLGGFWKLEIRLEEGDVGGWLLEIARLTTRMQAVHNP